MNFPDLPNELLLDILNQLSTSSILHIATVSHRFYALVCRLLHQRLQSAALLPEHTLLLECYHPSAKLTEPPFYCTYLETQGLDKGEPICKEDVHMEAISVGRLGEYRGIYSVYRPQRQFPEEHDRRPRHPAGDVPGSRTHPSSASSWIESTSLGDTVRQRLMLEGHELFTQLVACLNLARAGPRRGLFFSFVDVSEGFIRIWRDWLKIAAASCLTDLSSRSTAQKGMSGIENDARILWVDTAKTVGLRLEVRESRWRRDVQVPVLMAHDEDMPVSYDIEYRGMCCALLKVQSLARALMCFYRASCSHIRSATYPRGIIDATEHSVGKGDCYWFIWVNAHMGINDNTLSSAHSHIEAQLMCRKNEKSRDAPLVTVVKLLVRSWLIPKS